MSFSEIMLWLAEEWVIGYSVACSVVVVSYLLYSILLVVSCRKIGYDVGVSGMLPIWNIVVLLKRIHKGYKLTKESNSFEDEEFDIFS